MRKNLKNSREKKSLKNTCKAKKYYLIIFSLFESPQAEYMQKMHDLKGKYNEVRKNINEAKNVKF